MNTLTERRISIGSKVRALRVQRRWTQAELAERVNLSQSRLSEIENGKGSFTAEQFLEILKLFNVGVDHFVSDANDPTAERQNALVRLGARHLQERDDVLIGKELADVGNALHAALVSGEPRLIAALAPVLVLHIDELNADAVRSRLAPLGLQRRLDWLFDNTLHAVEDALRGTPPRPWAQRYRRARLVLDAALGFAKEHRLPPPGSLPDILDGHIRSKATLNEVIAGSSELSRRWGIVTALQPRDFVEALRAARGRD